MKDNDEGMGTSLPNCFSLIEVFAILLLVTMGAAAAELNELKVRMAKVPVARQVSARPTPKMFVQVNAGGAYFVQGAEFKAEQVALQIRQSVAGTYVLIEPDEKTPWQYIASVISAAEAAGREHGVRVTQNAKEDKQP